MGCYGMGWRMTGETLVHCAFLKTWLFFDDYSNPTKDLSANWLAYRPRPVFLSLKHNRRPPTLINLQVPL